MDSIRVNILPSTKYGRLYYRPDPERDKYVLYLHNQLDIKLSFTINITSGIVLDLDNNQILKGVEFSIPRKFWKIIPIVEAPQPLLEADLQVTNIAVKHEAMEPSIHIFTDKTYDNVVFTWVDNIEGKWVSLSDRCFALIKDETLLAGFFVKLINKKQEIM
jgi:hypothetical protein